MQAINSSANSTDRRDKGGVSQLAYLAMQFIAARNLLFVGTVFN
jgi:hypothetical protein